MSLLEFYIPEWIFVALSLAILVFALSKLFWKPVNKILEQRQADVAKAIGDAQEIEAEKLSMDARREELKEELEQMTADKMKEARVRAGREYDRIVDDAENKARLIIASAQAQAARERQSMIEQARVEIVSAAIDATGTLLGANMSGERNEQIVREFISKRGIAG